MEQPESLLIDKIGVAPVWIKLLELQVPVAEIVPPEVIQLVGGLIVAMLLEVAIRRFRARVQAAGDPAVRQGNWLARTLARLAKQETGRVPDLVGEGLQRIDTVFAQRDIAARRGAHEQCKTDRIGPILVVNYKWIDGIALGLGHLLALGVTYQAVDM